VQVVETLTRALRLTSAERAHLFRLAGYLPPGSGTVPAYLTPGVRRMLDRLGDVEPQRGTTKVIDHPQAGRLTLDCDVLSVAGADLHLMVHTAEPGTPDADRLALALGTRSFVG
jgi:hypothetical protein